MRKAGKMITSRDITNARNTLLILMITTLTSLAQTTCLNPGRVDLAQTNGVTWFGTTLSPHATTHRNPDEMMLLCGASYTMTATEVRVSENVEYTDAWGNHILSEPWPGNPEAYPSVQTFLNGALVAGNTYTFVAPTTPNTTGTLEQWPFWGGVCGVCNMTGVVDPYRTFKVSVSRVRFENELPLRKYAGAWSMGPLYDPTSTTWDWIDDGTVNNPVAYPNGKSLRITYRLSVTPTPPAAWPIFIRAKIATSVVLQPTPVNFAANTTTFDSAAVDVSLTESVIKIASYPIIWEASEDQANWVPIGQSGPHKVFWTYGVNFAPEFASSGGFVFEGLYDFALEQACAFASGQSTPNGIFASVCRGVAANAFYNPSIVLDGQAHPLLAFSIFQQCMCADQSNLGRGLLRSLGLNAYLQYLFGGPNSRDWGMYRTLDGYGVSARFNRPAHDAGGALPHFVYHAVIYPGGITLYDPSYGDSYVSNWTPLEVGTGMSAQSSSRFPADSTNTGFTCPHNH